MKVDLPATLRSQIMAAARAAYPGECCGLLQGVRDGDRVRITALHAARNLSDDPHCFQIDPADHFAAQKAARANGCGLVGCYHSHPAGRAEPSAADLTGAGEDGFVWLIAAGETLNAFIYLDGGFGRLDWVADWVTSSE